MRSSGKSMVSFVALLVSVLGCLEHHDVPSPRRDLWPHSECAAVVGTGTPAFDVARMLDLANAAIGRHADSAALGSAYAYARTHCYPLWFGSGDRLMLEADYAEAFFFYLHASFSSGESTISPPFDRMHIELRLQNALTDASKGKFAASLSTMREISTIAPEFPDAHYYQGGLLLALHEPAKARAEWLTALRCHGTNAPNKAKVGPDDAWMSALLMYESKVK